MTFIENTNIFLNYIVMDNIFLKILSYIIHNSTDLIVISFTFYIGYWTLIFYKNQKTYISIQEKRELSKESNELRYIYHEIKLDHDKNMYMLDSIMDRYSSVLNDFSDFKEESDSFFDSLDSKMEMEMEIENYLTSKKNGDVSKSNNEIVMEIEIENEVEVEVEVENNIDILIEMDIIKQKIDYFKNEVDNISTDVRIGTKSAKFELDRGTKKMKNLKSKYNFLSENKKEFKKEIVQFHKENKKIKNGFKYILFIPFISVLLFGLILITLFATTEVSKDDLSIKEYDILNVEAIKYDRVDVFGEELTAIVTYRDGNEIKTENFLVSNIKESKNKKLKISYLNKSKNWFVKKNTIYEVVISK